MAFSFSAMKEKAGPLPVWAWAVLTGLGLILVMYYLKGRAAVNNTSASTSPSTTVATDPYAAFANYAAAPTTQPTTDQGPSGSYETNQSWISKAITYLTPKGYTGLQVQSALLNYQNGGGPLSPTDTDIVNAALSQFGTPPDGVTGVPTGSSASSHPTVQSYIRSPNGSISVVYNNNTKGEFTAWGLYQAFSVRHPAGPAQNVSQDVYASIPTAETNPSW